MSKIFKITNILIFRKGILKRSLTIVGGDNHLLTEIPDFNSVLKKGKRLHCNDKEVEKEVTVK